MEVVDKALYDKFTYWDTFSVDRYTHCIEEETFPAEFVNVTVAEAKEIVRYMQNVFDVMPLDTAMVDLNEVAVYPEGNEVLCGLIERLEICVKRAVDKSGGAFVKLSDRSPKDVASEYGRLVRLLDKPLNNLANQLDITMDELKHDRRLLSSQYGLPAVYRAFTSAMKVYSGFEAFQLVVVSFRVYEDISNRLGLLETYDLDFSLVFCIREWVDIDPSWEYRAFVCNNKLNAISQYFFDCYFPSIEEKHEKLKQAIHEYWMSIKNAFPYDDYVVDFVIFKNDPHPSNIKVIELNPFDESTDSALFHWKLHSKTLREGNEKGISFKYVKAPTIQTKKNWWLSRLNQYFNTQPTESTIKTPY